MSKSPLFKTISFRQWRASIFLLGLLALTSCKDRKDSDAQQSGLMNTNLVYFTSQPPEPANTKVLPSLASPAVPSNDDLLIQEILYLFNHGETDAALAKATAAIQANPKDTAAYFAQGHVYTELRLWDKAEQAYKAILLIDSQNSNAKFDLSELKFKQKSYDEARPGFYALEVDANLGDLATYKVFLCDLLGGHETVAESEFDHFNQVDSNASYHFGNAAWYFYHHNRGEAEDWLQSGLRIYAPSKAALYVYSLNELGYTRADATARQDNPPAGDAPIPPATVNATNMP